jgi:hypothetical protein
MNEIQLGVQAVKASLDAWTQCLCEELLDTKKELQETQTDIQTTKALAEATQSEFRTQLKEVEA